MDEKLARRFFKHGIPDDEKNRVVNILVLADFSSEEEDALKIE